MPKQDENTKMGYISADDLVMSVATYANTRTDTCAWTPRKIDMENCAAARFGMCFLCCRMCLGGVFFCVFGKAVQLEQLFRGWKSFGVALARPV